MSSSNVNYAKDLLTGDVSGPSILKDCHYTGERVLVNTVSVEKAGTSLRLQG